MARFQMKEMNDREYANRRRHETIIAILFCLAVVLGLGFAHLNHSELLIGRFMQDSMLWAEAVYRMSLGQALHRDFLTPIGSLMFVVPHLFYEATGSMSVALKSSHLLFGTFILLVGVIITLNRMSLSAALILSFFCCLAAATPIMFGGGHQDLTVGLHYNRLGWAALFLTSVSLLPRRPGGNGALVLESCLFAALVCLLFFTKISFFLSALGLIIVGMLCVPESRKHLLLGSLIVAIILSVVAVLASGLFWSYLANVQDVVAVSGSRIKPLTAFLNVKNELLLFAGGCLAVIYLVWTSQPKPTAFAKLQVLALLFAVLVMSLANFNQNFQYRLMMTLLFPWALAANILCRQVGQSDRDRLAPFITLGLILALLGPIVNWARALRTLSKPLPQNELHVRYPNALDGIVQRLNYNDVHTAFAEDRSYDLTIETFPDQILGRLSVIYWRNTQLGRAYQDGLTALAPMLEQNPDLQIETVDFMNPFPMMTATVPPKGVMIARSLREIDFANPPAAEVMFAEPDVVMIPRYPQDQQVSTALVCSYADHLERNFAQINKTGYWFVLERSTPGAATTNEDLRAQCS